MPKSVLGVVRAWLFLSLKLKSSNDSYQNYKKIKPNEMSPTTAFERTTGASMYKLVIAVLSVLLLPSCGTGSGLIGLNPNPYKLLDGYRTRGASHALLGSYGRKIGNVQFGYERVNVPKFKDVPLRKVTEIDVTEDQKKQLEKAGVDFKALADASLETSGSTDKKAKYKVVFMEVLNLNDLRRELRSMLKRDPDALADLTDKDARVVITSGLIFEHNAAEKIEAKISAGASLKTVKGSPEIQLKGSVSANDTIKVSDQTVVAYQFARLCWQNGKLRALVRDAKTIDIAACPSNSSYKYPG